MDAILTPPTILRETLGARLRRLAAAAQIANPLILDPWLPPPAWASGTAYGTGTVVAANGGWHACAAAGTSAASGTGPSHASGAILADNSVLWSYLGPAQTDAADPGAPALSAATATPSNPNDNAFTPVQHPGLFRLLGSFGEPIVTNYLSPYGFESKAATRDYGHGGFGVETDAAVVAFRLYTNQPSPRLLVDGRYLAPGGFPRSASSTWHTLTFPTRRKRSLVFEGPKDAWIVSSLAIPRSAQLRPLPAPEIRAAFIGDSLFAGSSYGPWTAGNSVPGRIGKWLGWGDVWNLAKGGTGWIATGGGYYTYGQRVAQAAALAPDVLVFGCPTNDSGQPAADITAAVAAALQGARAAGYAGPIIVLGAWPKNDANVATIEAAVADGVAAAGDPLAFFIPLFATSYAPVVCGAWNNGFNPLMDNASLALSGDGTHPAEPGIAILSDFVAQEIRRTVLPLLR